MTSPTREVLPPSSNPTLSARRTVSSVAGPRRKCKPCPLDQFQGPVPAPSSLGNPQSSTGSRGDPLVVEDDDFELPDPNTPAFEQYMNDGFESRKRKRTPKAKPDDSDSDIETISVEYREVQPNASSPVRKKRKAGSQATKAANPQASRPASNRAGSRTQKPKTPPDNIDPKPAIEASHDPDDKIYITTKCKVDRVEHIKEIPKDAWTIPSGEAVAYILDYSNIAIPSDIPGIDHLIRKQVQETWHAQSTGHLAGDVFVKKGILSPNQEVRTRRIPATCKGVKVCSFFPLAEWADLERCAPEIERTRQLGRDWLEATAEENKRLQPKEEM